MAKVFIGPLLAVTFRHQVGDGVTVCLLRQQLQPGWFLSGVCR